MDFNECLISNSVYNVVQRSIMKYDNKVKDFREKFLLK